MGESGDRRLAPGQGPDPSETPDRALRRLVWDQIEPLLPNVKTVILIPDGSLTRVPWYAMPGKSPGSYLIHDYAIAVAAHGQQLCGLLSQAPNPVGRLLVVGAIDYDSPPAAEPTVDETANSPQRRALRRPGSRPWPSLSGTAGEAEVIAGLWGHLGRVTPLSGTGATEAALAREMPMSKYIHIATHGFFADAEFPSAFQTETNDDRLLLGGVAMRGARSTVAERNPFLLSGLVLAGANLPQKTDAWGAATGDDGILTAEEMVDLDLSGTDLVVLSACETGLGMVAGNEGVFGLQRAFHLAGARTVVASLWKVPDAATQELMKSFYENMWKKNQPKLEALRQAQLMMLNKEIDNGDAGSGLERIGPPGSRATPTWVWAAWSLSGDWH
jgi:CHAT domain-containing protein